MGRLRASVVDIDEQLPLFGGEAGAGVGKAASSPNRPSSSPNRPPAPASASTRPATASAAPAPQPGPARPAEAGSAPGKPVVAPAAAPAAAPSAAAVPLHAPAALRIFELGELPARFLASLPAPWAAVGRHPTAAAPIVLTTSKPAYAAARARRWPVFVGRELLALALAAQHERLVGTDLPDWCARKAQAPEWKLTPQVALGLGPAGARLELGDVTVAEMLRAADLELIDAVVGDEDGRALIEQLQQQREEAA